MSLTHLQNNILQRRFGVTFYLFCDQYKWMVSWSVKESLNEERPGMKKDALVLQSSHCA